MNNNQQETTNNLNSSLISNNLDLKELNKQKDELTNKLNSIHQTIEILKHNEDEINLQLEEIDKKIHFETFSTSNKKQLSNDEIANQLKRIRKAALAATVAVWLCWTGIGFFAWFFLQIFTIQELLKFYETNVKKYLCTTLSIFSIFFIPAFFNGIIVCIVLKKRINMYKSGLIH